MKTNPLRPVTIPGIVLGEELGAGGFGMVWAATSEKYGDVAIKVGHGATPLSIARFEREARALASVGAPAVPEAFDSGVLSDGRPFIVMSRLRGETLARKLSNGPLAASEVVALLDSLLCAIAKVHDAGLVHRDLKPANIIIEGERVVVMDFGITQDVADSRLTQTGFAVGTVAYSSPEQLVGAELDARSDLYSIGAILYELLTGSRPFDGDRASIEKGQLMLRPQPPRTRANVPADLDRLCLDLLAKSPADRPESADATIRRLRARSEKAAVAGPTEQTTPRGALQLASQPVVLVGHLGNGGRAVARLIERNGGIIARQGGGRTIGVFSATLTPDPLAAAIATARMGASDLDLDFALHLGRVLLRRRSSGPPNCYGAVLDERTWIEAAKGTVLRATDELAAASPTLRSGGTGDVAKFVGRADEAALACKSIDEVAAGGAQVLTVRGGAGLGKTRLIVEAQRLAQVAGFRVLRAKTSHGSDAGVIEQLLNALGLASSGERIGSGPAAVSLLVDGLRQTASSEPVAIFLDDAHRADKLSLDALEAAASASRGLRLWIVVSVDSSFRHTRPAWGKRVDSAQEIILSPLSEEASMELAAHHLEPAEYPPASALRSLAEWSGGNPQLLVELTGELRRMGAVRLHANGNSWYLATDVLANLPAATGIQWLVTRRLAALAQELAVFVRLCAVLGETVDRHELAWMLESLERDNVETSRIDPGVGMAELALAGWFRQSDVGEFSFSSEAARAALYELIRTDDRQLLHQHALRYAREIDDPARIARHASASEEAAAAAEAYCRLAEIAEASADHVRVDQLATSALGQLERQGQLTVRALIIRGRARHHFHRPADAVVDLSEAARIAEIDGLDAQRIEALLEKATALDWMWQFEESARTTEVVGELLAPETAERLVVRHMLALGRAKLRQARLDVVVASHSDDPLAESAKLLNQVVARASALCDHETEVVARVLLPIVELMRGDLEASERLFETTLAFCQARGDIHHLNVAVCNRCILWQAKNDVEAAIRDSRRSARLAQETGQPLLEGSTTHNLAELLFFRGDDDEAIELGERALLLFERFTDPSLTTHNVLMARIHTARGDHQQASKFIRAASEGLRPEGQALERLFLRVLEHSGDWQSLLDEISELPADVAVEVHYWAARDLAKQGLPLSPVLAAAAPLLERCPVWSTRFATLERS